jgi:NAD-dependent SIR2 family protein deacetylase
MEAAQECDLFLVVGISLRHVALNALIYDIACTVRGRRGAVIYVDPRENIGRNIESYVDFHFKVTSEEFAQRVMAVMSKVIHGGFS